MSYWNYRVVVESGEGKEDILPEVFEVYYNDEHVPYGYSRASVCGESTDELLTEVQRFKDAIMQRWLVFPDDFEKNIDFNSEGD